MSEERSIHGSDAADFDSNRGIPKVDATAGDEGIDDLEPDLIVPPAVPQPETIAGRDTIA